MKEVKVDQAKCIGCGLCASLCGEVFELETGKSQIKEKAKIEEHEGCIKEAIINCPTEAIDFKNLKK